MKIEHIEAISKVRQNLSSIILECQPFTAEEWTAFDKLTSAYRMLRGVDLNTLQQLGLPGFEASKIIEKGGV